MKEDVKYKGQVYTPISIVNMMLDYAGYIVSDYILNKHVIDNSCGDGRILGEVVKRYIESHNILDGDIREELKEYIHGIDYDVDACVRCREYLNDILKSHHIKPIEWDIRPANALAKSTYDYGDFQGKMDYVFGNPPYVRMKNIKKSDKDNYEYQVMKGYSFTEKGMSDLYLAFYELGLEMRNNNGILCYIAPSSWVNSQSGEVMRRYIEETKELAAVIDFEHTQVFFGATTYVMITLFEMKPNKFVRYDKYDDDTKEYYPDKIIPYERLFVDDRMFFVSESDYEVIKEVFKPHKKFVEVKNGYATLADDVFIDDFPGFDDYTIPVLKASTLKWKYCLFPYDNDLNLIPLEKIKETSPEVYNYLVEHAETLQKRTYDSKMINDTWHSLGRSQGLKDTFVKKISLNTLVKDVGDIKMNIVPAGCGVYSGLYIPVVDGVSPGEIARMLMCDKFINYVKSLRKYKSGGYYTFSSKDVERYLNYMIEMKGC